jgi:type I restriction enzyme S subunit
VSAEWEQKLLGQVLRLEYGKPLDEADRKPDGLHPVYGANGEKDRTDKFYVDKPSIIVGRKGSAGEVNLSEAKFWPLDVTYFVRFDDRQYDLRFLFYMLKSLELPNLAKGVKPGINRSEVYSEVVRIAPLPEQQRIVAILDEAFADIAAAKANAEKNLQNARALFESHLESTFGEGVESTRLTELASEITDGDHSPPPKATCGVPFITISDIEKSTRTINFDETFFVPETYFHNLKPNKRPKVGDVLYTVTGATLGIPVLVKQDVDFCFQRHIGLIRPREDTDSTWLSYALLSPQVFRQATEESTGAAQKTVSLAVLRNITVPKIPLSEQRGVAARLDSIDAEVRHLETISRQKIAALEALKKSVLHRAFDGQL